MAFDLAARIQARHGIAKAAGISLAADLLPLCEAAIDDRLGKKLKKLTRKVRALSEASAPPMPRHQPGSFEQLDAGQWITALQKAQPAPAVNGHDLHREVSYGQGIPPYHPER